MSGMKEIIQEAVSLPVEERAMVVDSLLRSLNTPDPEMDRLWVVEAQRRLSELRAGRVQGVSGPKLFEEIRHSFDR